MTANARLRPGLVDQAILVFSSISMLWVVIALVAIKPYAGFSLSPDDGEIITVYVDDPGLNDDDRVISIDGLTLDEFNRDRWSELFVGVETGDRVPIVIERDGVQQTVQWVFPGPTRREIGERLFSNGVIGVVFFAAAWVTALVVRPRDDRRRLLIAFFCVSAIWLTASAASASHVWGTMLILRSAIWLSVPIYWHLHWSLPRPLGRVPRMVWVVLYGAAAVLAALEWVQVLPEALYQLALAAAMLPIPFLWVMHGIKQREERSSVWLLGLLVLLILLPLIGTALVSLDPNVPSNAGVAAFFLLALPFLYLTVIFRRRLGGMQYRVNHYISLFAYWTLLATVGLSLTAWAAAHTTDSAGTLTVGLGAGLAAALITAVGQRPFQYWFQQKFLGMRLPPTRVLDGYSARIAGSLSAEGLTRLLQHDVLPSLLVREALLVRLEGNAAPVVMLNVGITEAERPSLAEAQTLAAASGRYQAPEQSGDRPCPWVRVPFALKVNERLVGVLLLGKRDPDDYYDRSELERIGTLAQQVAVALSHIGQARQLLDLNQHNLSVSEAERTSLARELHDGPMNRLALMLQSLPPDTLPEVSVGIKGVIDSLRRTASGLRPPTLDYGLHPALRSLVHDLEGRVGALLGPEVEVTLEVESSPARYDPQVELHLFRIAQQASYNAVQHAGARHIRIEGTLAEGQIDLTVSDDGRGFAAGESLELGELVTRRHFGLAGMHERAQWVEARLEIHARVGHGTRVRVIWAAPLIT